MLSGKIYLRSDEGLVTMQETKYDAEAILQALVADYPDLLAGDQMRPAAPRRWILVEREAGIEDSVGGLARFSLDHLFLDQDAIPTLVEVKRSSDTRIRREVVGQMLDYAANVVAHWPPGELRNRFAERAGVRASDPDSAILALVGSSDAAAVDAFWQSADANMTARRIRLVFVADVIPTELVRIIEFLNESFVRAEVFGVEVRQFVGEGHQTLVPRVVGRTATAEQVKQASAGGSRVRHWTIDTLRDEAVSLGGEHARRLFDSVVSWSREHGIDPSLGVGKGGPIYIEALLPNGGTVKVASYSAAGYLYWNYMELARVPPFDDVERRLDCNRRLNAIPGVTIDDRYARDSSWPTIRGDALDTAEALELFYAVVDWVTLAIAATPAMRPTEAPSGPGAEPGG